MVGWLIGWLDGWRGPKVTRSLPNQSYDESIAIHSTRGFCSPGGLIHRLPHHPSLFPYPKGGTHRNVQVATTLWLRHHSECLTSQDRSRTPCQYKRQTEVLQGLLWCLGGGITRSGAGIALAFCLCVFRPHHSRGRRGCSGGLLRAYRPGASLFIHTTGTGLLGTGQLN